MYVEKSQYPCIYVYMIHICIHIQYIHKYLHINSIVIHTNTTYIHTKYMPTHSYLYECMVQTNIYTYLYVMPQLQYNMDLAKTSEELSWLLIFCQTKTNETCHNLKQSKSTIFFVFFTFSKTCLQKIKLH